MILEEEINENYEPTLEGLFGYCFYMILRNKRVC